MIDNYRNNEILKMTFKKVVSNFEARILDSDERLFREIYHQDDGYRCDEVYMEYDQIAEISSGDKIFWLGCGRKIQEWPRFDGVADLMIMNINWTPFSEGKNKKGQELLEIVLKKYSYGRFGVTMACARNDGSFSFHYSFKLGVSAEEMMEKFVVQKPEFNSRYLFETGESMFVKKEILYNADFAYFLAEKLEEYIKK